MDISYKEKSLIGSLFATLIVYGVYFYNVFSEPENNRIGLFIGAVILTIILEIIIQSLLAVTHKTLEDERDKKINLIAHRNSYACLAVGVWLVIGHLLIVSLLDLGGYEDWVSPYLLGNILFLAFILAELTHFMTQLVYYRRGV